MRIRRWLMLAAMAGVLAGVSIAKAQEAPPGGTPAPAKTEPMDGGAKPAEGKKVPDAATDGKGGGNMNTVFLVVMFGGLILMMVFMNRGKRKDAHRRAEMLAAIKKGDKVTSIGGIIGTVMDVKADEITVKVDESTNTRMKFARWAIRGVGDAAKVENQTGAEKKP